MRSREGPSASCVTVTCAVTVTRCEETAATCRSCTSITPSTPSMCARSLVTSTLAGVTFFVFTGGLSSVLDNAPTYATFFEMAGKVPHPGGADVAGVPELYLVSISLGAVLCGAITYIGNGPNFMVKSVAESDGVEMPSFGGYVGRSMKHLVPVIAAMVLLFIAPGVLWKVLGGVLTVGLLALDARLLSRSRRLALADQSEGPDD